MMQNKGRYQNMYFLEVARQGSFSKAAKNLFISQPSLSASISNLEAELGVRLFDRSNYPIKLTYAGEKYLEYVKADLELLNRMQAQMDDIREGIAGQVTVGINAVVGAMVLEKILPVFTKRYPNIRVIIDEGFSSTYLQNKLVKDQVDCGIVFLDSQYRASRFEPLIRCPFLLICRKDHPFARNRDTSFDHPVQISLEETKDENFILLGKKQVARIIIDRLYSSCGITPMIFLESQNIQTVISLCVEGLGLAFVPQIYLNGSPHLDRLAFFEIAGHPMEWTLSVVYNKSNIVTNATQKFISTAKELYLPEVLTAER